jgi:uncharacterized protein YgbK (DUF1537 family)
MAAMQSDMPSRRRWPISRVVGMQTGVRRLIVAGGETSAAAVDCLGIPGFLIGAGIAAGVAVLRAAGAENRAMLLALKSGNFADTEFFSDALRPTR